MRLWPPFRACTSAAAAAVAVIAAVPASGQDVLTTRFDTLANRVVAPGVRHLSLRAPAGPWNVFVLEVDLRTASLGLEAVKANDRFAGGLERTTAMAARREAPGRRVVGAINAGFFSSNGAVNGIQVVGGEVVGSTWYPNGSYASTAIGRTGRVAIRSMPMTATLTAGGVTTPLAGINAARTGDALVLYNRYHGATTGTDASGTELVVRPLGAGWAVNDTVRLEVVERRVGAGNTTLAPGLAVLSGSGTGAAVLNARAVGDVVRLVQRAPGSLPGLAHAVSGFPQLLAGGQRSALAANSHNTTRHPRTATGVNRDTTRMWLVVVDGRSTASVGMTSAEQQDLFVRLGAWSAQGLDGGGSSTMVVGGQIVNRPSDGTERSVGDALLVTTAAPPGALVRVQASLPDVRPFIGRAQAVSLRGLDVYGASVVLPFSGATVTVTPSGLGRVADGVFTAAMAPGSGHLRVRVGDLTDSVAVTVKGIRTHALLPAASTVDTARPVTLRMHVIDTDGAVQVPVAGETAWQVLDPRVGTIDAGGVFRGLAPGTTRVVGRLWGVSDTATVQVSVGTGSRTLDPLDGAAGWRVGGAGIDTVASTFAADDDPAASGGRSVRFGYRFTEADGVRPVARLLTDRRLDGVPDSLVLRVRSDGAAHRGYAEFVDAEGTPFLSPLLSILSDSVGLARVGVALNRASIGADAVVYPVRLVALRIDLAFRGGRTSGATYAGALWFDDLRVTYPTRATAAEPPLLPGTTGFGGVHPNPATDRATVALRAGTAGPLRVTLHDALGRRLRVVFDGSVDAAGTTTFDVDTSGLPSGVYVLRTADGMASQPFVVRR